MLSLSLRNHLVSRALFASVTLLLMPLVTQAQSASLPSKIAGNPQETIEDRIKRQQKTQKSILVTVDYVDVSAIAWHKASALIALGQQHDALLLAALVKSGASDMHGTPVQTWDGSTVLRGGPAVMTAGNSQFQEKGSTTEATPHFNTDGTITVNLKLELNAYRWPSQLPPEMNQQSASPTFHDGQTILIRNSVTTSAAGAVTAHLIFVRVAVLAMGESINFQPMLTLSSPLLEALTPLTPFGPRLMPHLMPESIDPGMVGKPTNTYDQNMAGGRGAHPERLDHMNAWPVSVPNLPVSVPAVPKRK